MTTTKLAVAVIAVLLLCAVVVYGTNAGDIPEGVEVFALHNTGRICVVFPDGSGDCFCPCEVNCANILPSNTPVPTKETPEPRDTPTEEPTEEPQPTQMASCNRGIGNDSEGCDPGNSSGQGQGAGRDAGEDRDEKKKDK